MRQGPLDLRDEIFCVAGAEFESRPAVFYEFGDRSDVGRDNRSARRECFSRYPSERLVPLCGEDEHVGFPHQRVDILHRPVSQPLHVGLPGGSFYYLIPQWSVSYDLEQDPRSGRSQAASMVSVPFSGASRPTNKAYPPPPWPRPGSGATKLGFTTIFPAGRPPSMNLFRANSVRAT